MNIGRELEGNGGDVIKLLSYSYLGGSKENHEKLYSR
jgi:hypothetical protein